MTSLVLELDKQINELRERAQVEPGNAALRLQLDELVQQQINALFDSSRKIIEQVDDALKICRKARAEIGAEKALAKPVVLSTQQADSTPAPRW